MSDIRLFHLLFSMYYSVKITEHNYTHIMRYTESMYSSEVIGKVFDVGSDDQRRHKTERCFVISQIEVLRTMNEEHMEQDPKTSGYLK